jgi:2-oxoglutarate dehydrogenase E2 component (dihydrolipoamide succinyltransferase)
MTIKVLVPALGESVVEATVANWLKQEGEPVKAGEPIVSLETDKVDLDVPATQDGVLSKIERQQGEDVQVGDVLALIEEGAAGAAEATAATREAKTTPASPKQQAAPSRQKAQETPKAQEGVEGRKAGNGVEPAPDAHEPAADKAERATPVAKRVAADKGVDLADAPATGPGGRITRRDVESFVQERETAEAPSTVEARAPEKPEAMLPAMSSQPSADGRREERVRMSRRRRTIAERLVEAQQTAAMLTTFNEVDMSAVMEMRQRRREEFKTRHGVGLGFMSFFVKATVGALKTFPQLNASIEGSEFVLKHYVDIGIAVGAEEGLVVPVLRDADRMSFAEIEKKINEFVEKVQNNTLTLEDLRGGTFTITNGGVFGSLLSTPILNPPQVGILGMHKIEPRPVVVNGEIVIRSMMYVALSYDHRIVDGREAVQFLVTVKRLIEDPEALLLEG